MVKVNPEILKWARETAGYSIEEASKKLKLNKTQEFSFGEKLQALERGEIEPSRTILTKMEKLYHRPLVLFYLERLPRKADRVKDYRSLPDNYPDITNGIVDSLIRNVQVRQNILREAIEDDEDTEPLVFVNSIRVTDDVNLVVQKIVEKILFDLNKFRNFSNSREAFKYLRALVENTGVYVLLMSDLGSHHTSIGVEVFRGFTLADTIAPFIVINDNDSEAARSFTLIHELTHIWLGSSGISGGDYYSKLKIESFCNKVASELLLPKWELKKLNLINTSEFETLKGEISEFANHRNVSSTMVAYNLYLHGSINYQTWKNLAKDYKKLWIDAKNTRRESHRKKSGGPTYYQIRRYLLGENLISQVHQMVLGGTLTTVKAGIIFNVSPKNVGKFFERKFN